MPFPMCQETARSPILLLCLVIALCTDACGPSESSRTVDDLQDIANQAGTVVNIVQSSRPQSNQEREDNLSALKFAAAASRAAWLAASESNSIDSLPERNLKVAEAFSAINAPDLGQGRDLPARAAVDTLQSGIDILRGRLQESEAQIRASRRAEDRIPTEIPAAMTGRLQKIKEKATETLARSNSLLGLDQR